ncbi:MAG: type II toxin-antitoxin system MqsA family antitoxin [Defluviitaleaceae bacterium]|nr:type II toxin-antitoxin system MqsA family antitoxin [Defluviitaleaceae bacterium]
MKCLYCKGNMINETTSDVTDLKTCIVVIRNVPCHKCTQCGETAYDLSVGERLEQIIDSVKETMMEVAIITYSDKAA